MANANSISTELVTIESIASIEGYLKVGKTVWSILEVSTSWSVSKGEVKPFGQKKKKIFQNESIAIYENMSVNCYFC